MFGLPRSASALWVTATLAGFGAVVASCVVASGDLRRAPVAALFVLSGAIAESFKIPLPTSRPGNHVDFSVSPAILIAAILVLPPQWAILVVALAFAIGNRATWYKRIYNVAQLSVTAAAAALVWRVLGGSATPGDVYSAPGMAIAALTYFSVNTTFTSSIVSLASGLPIRITLWRSHRHTWQTSLGMVFIGVLIAVLWSSSPWTIALAAVPLTAIFFAFRNTISLQTHTIDALFNLADILDARDPYTHGHSLRVGQYAEKLALAMGLSGDEAHLIFLAGRLHDIGKCAIRNEVLLKPGALTEEEREHMCIHPEVGSSMLASFSLFSECARYVRAHHERWDGNGYPDKLAGENIPLGARIIAVADTFDAMTTTRPYRKALPLAEARKRLKEGAGTQWDARAIAVFLRLLETTPLGQTEPTPLPTQASPTTKAA
jgi:putative nucleotidyltransferase with HDIG domain